MVVYFWLVYQATTPMLIDFGCFYTVTIEHCPILCFSVITPVFIPVVFLYIPVVFPWPGTTVALVVLIETSPSVAFSSFGVIISPVTAPGEFVPPGIVVNGVVSERVLSHSYW